MCVLHRFSITHLQHCTNAAEPDSSSLCDHALFYLSNHVASITQNAIWQQKSSNLWAAGLKHKCVQHKLVILNSNWQWLSWHHLRNLVRLSRSHRLYNFVLFPHFRATQKQPETSSEGQISWAPLQIVWNLHLQLSGKTWMHVCLDDWLTERSTDGQSDDSNVLTLFFRRVDFSPQQSVF